jgi:hypothetical protein
MQYTESSGSQDESVFPQELVQDYTGNSEVTPIVDVVADHLDPDSLSFREKFRSLREALGEDFKKSGPLQKLGLLTTAAWLAYEWGPGNETVTPIIGGHVINNVSGPAGMVKVAAVTAGFTFVQQTLSGTTLAATATQFPKAAKKTSELMKDEDQPELSAKPWKELPLSKRLLYAFTMGTTFVATREAGVTGEVGFKNNLKRVLGSAALCAAGVGVIGASVEAVDYYADDAPALIQEASDVGISVATSPLFWLGLLGLSTYRDARKRNALRKQLAENQV